MSNIQRGKSSCYCINLRRAANAVSQLYDESLKPTGLSVNQFSLLRNIRRLGSCSVSDLAVYVGQERTTLVRTLKPLLVQGLIEDKAEQGRRNRELQITEQGNAVLDKGAALWKNAQTQIEEKLGAEDLAQLERILSRLAE